MSDHAELVSRLLGQAGRTFADDAGFTLRNKPGPLWELTVLTIALAKPISADLAVAAAAELRRAGATTPDGMLALTWQQRVDACVRAHYRRFDESTATRMEQAATFVNERWRGDLRGLAAASDGDVDRAGQLLQEIPGLGPAGADIFRREAQQVWTWLRPFLDDRALDGARALGLPTRPATLAGLVREEDLGRFAAALVRAGLDDDLATGITRPEQS